MTTFERRIVSLLVDEGLSNKEIADRANLCEQTVKNQLRNIFAKLDVENRVQLASLWHTEIFQLGLAS